MQILAIFDKQTLELKRLAGPMPIDPKEHVFDGEGYMVCDTTIPKYPAQIQAEVIEFARGKA